MKIQNHFKVCLYFLHIFNNRCIIISQYLLFAYLGSKALILLWPGRLILGLICFSAKSQAPAGTLGKNWRCNLEGIGKEFSRGQRRHTQFISRFFRESEEKARMVGKGEKLVGSVIRGARQWAFCFQLFASNPRFFESASFPAQKGAWTGFLLEQDDCWGGGERKCIS